MRPRALDLFCCGGGVSEGLRRAGFEVVGVDIADHSRVYRSGPGRLCLENPATFEQLDAMTVLDQLRRAQRGASAPLFDAPPFRGGFDFIWASPPCQAHSTLRHLQAGKVYPDLIEPTRELLQKWGGLWCIENVPGAPLGGANLTMLCGSMFGLQTPDGRAELRRHRLFETSFSIPLRPACQHGRAVLCAVGDHPHSAAERHRERRGAVIPVTGHTPVDNRHRRRVVCVGGGKAMSAEPQGRKRRAMSITGNTPQTNVVRNQERETFSTADARAAMGIDWMPMKHLSQAIPPPTPSGSVARPAPTSTGRRRDLSPERFRRE